MRHWLNSRITSKGVSLTFSQEIVKYENTGSSVGHTIKKI